MTAGDAHEPLALDGIAYGVDALEALLVIHLGDAHVHAAFVRDGVGLAPAAVAATLRDAYRGGRGAARRLAISITAPAGAELPEPLVTLEAEGRTVLLRRVRAFVVAALFDASMPLGMARLLAARLAATLAHELPRGDAPDEPAPDLAAAPPPPDAGRAPAAAPPPAWRGAARPPRASPAEIERTRKLLALFDARAPEPHVARLRLALRAGLTPFALDHPDALGPEAMVLVETAVEDLLGLDRATLRRLL